MWNWMIILFFQQANRKEQSSIYHQFIAILCYLQKGETEVIEKRLWAETENGKCQMHLNKMQRPIMPSWEAETLIPTVRIPKARQHVSIPTKYALPR